MRCDDHVSRSLLRARTQSRSRFRSRGLAWVWALVWVLVSLGGAGVSRAVSPDSPFQPDLTPGFVLIDGDIQIPYGQYLALMSGEPLFDPAATFGPATLWPNNTVPFDFTLSGTGLVTTANQTLARDAMNEISARTGVVFRQAVAGDANRIRFNNSFGNNSPVGMVGGTQIINIASWGSQIIIIHEIYHSLGFQHEQSRPDRNTYVTINTANICTANAFNFNLVANAVTYGPYDFDSLMHYGRTAFTCNNQDTITVNAPWNADWQDRIGQRDHFSYYDVMHCRARYPRAGDRWLDRAHFGLPFGTFTDPFQSPNLADTINAVPAGGTLFIKFGNGYRGVGTHSKAITLVAPVGDVRFGN